MEFSNQILRTPKAARLLDVSERTLEKWRLTGDGPEFIRLGRRGVGYDVRDIESFISERRRLSTSDKGLFQQEKVTLEGKGERN